MKLFIGLFLVSTIFLTCAPIDVPDDILNEDMKLDNTVVQINKEYFVGDNLEENIPTEPRTGDTGDILPNINSRLLDLIFPQPSIPEPKCLICETNK